MTDFMGEIAIFAGTYAPKGWAFCNGQKLAINQHQALFSLLGTSYGGDGQKTFALPDLRSRVPVHAGTGEGLPEVTLGEKGDSTLSLPSARGTFPRARRRRIPSHAIERPGQRPSSGDGMKGI